MATPRANRSLTRLTKVCLALPEAIRATHGSHADFRVRKKVFAYFLNDHHGDGIVSVCVKGELGENVERASALPDLFYLPAYIGPRGWFGMRLDRGAIDWREVGNVVEGSYCLIAPRTLAKAVEALSSDSSEKSRKGATRASRWTPTAGVAAHPRESKEPRRGVRVSQARRLLLGLPSISEGRSYGFPSFLLNGRFFARFRDADTVLVLKLGTIDERDALMQLDPGAFFFTDHYRNSPAVLVRLAQVPRPLLTAVVQESWRQVAALRSARPRPKAQRRASRRAGRKANRVTLPRLPGLVALSHTGK